MLGVSYPALEARPTAETRWAFLGQNLIESSLLWKFGGAVHTDALAQRLVDLNKGEIVHVQGTIETTTLGAVILRSCNIS